jgi:hypothetical protein
MDITYYLTYDLPVPYRNIKIYPVTIKDYLLFNVYAGCLTIDKNSIPDAKIISMSNLEYIYYATSENVNETPYLLWFDRLLEMCLKDDETFKDMVKSMKRYDFTKDENPKPYFVIGNEIYKPKDFEVIKQIIAQQNMVELIDDNISKEVRDSLEKAKEYKRRESGQNRVPFEDYIVSLSISTGWSLDSIYSMTIRKFLKSIRRMDNLIQYKIYLAASLSGMVTFENKDFIKHWLGNIENEGIYDDVSVSLEELQDKVSLKSAKK